MMGYTAFYSVFTDITTMSDPDLNAYRRKLCAERDALSIRIKAIVDEQQKRNRFSPTGSRP